MSSIQHSSLARRLKRELPPSPPHPAILQTVGGRRWPYAYLEYCRAKCGAPFTLYPLDMPPMVFLADPEEIRKVLTGDATQLHPGAGGSIIAPLIGAQSFMLLDEDEHATGRKAVTPAFHKRMLQDQATALTDVLERSVASWPLRTPVALHSRIRALTLTAILRIIFSDQQRELDTLHALLMRMLSVTDTLLLQGSRLQHVAGWRGIWRRFVGQREEVDELIRQLVSCRRRSSALGDRGDLLDMLLVAENPGGSAFSEQQIRDNLVSMILAGHETTAGELAWAFLMLAHNPKVQSRLAEELCGGGDEYLTATVHETLRHKPVFVFTIPRKVITPVQIGAWTYRPPVQLAACTYLMHHNPDLYPDPHIFSPERFLGAAPQPRIWLPWGGGRKHCLGRHFAMLEVATILRHVVSTRVVLPTSEEVEEPRWRSAILVPRDGARVILDDRRNVGSNFF